MLHQQQQLAAQRQLSDRQLQQLAEQRQQVLHQRQASDHKLPPPTTTNPRDSVASSAGHGEHMPPLPHAQRKLDPASFTGTCTYLHML